MISALLCEYESMVGRKKFELLYAIICYYRMPKYRVRVLIRWLISTNSPFMKERVANKLMLKYGMEIAKNVKIGNNLKIEHFNGIVFGLGTVIGDNCTIYQQVTLGQKNGEYPIVGNNVVIYPGAKVLGGIHVGDNAVIAPNSVVLKDVENGAVFAGVPAKRIK
nr:serine acetyltransferase [uncultured Marvinbryantia sp.]